MTIKFDEIEDGYEFISGGAYGEIEAFLDTETGKVYVHSDYHDSDELPSDIDAPKYISLPHKRDLNLGKPLVIDFAHAHMPDHIDTVYDIFRRKGAYRNFKYLLHQTGLLDQWYQYETDAKHKALRNWCEINGIQIDEA